MKVLWWLLVCSSGIVWAAPNDTIFDYYEIPQSGKTVSVNFSGRIGSVGSDYLPPLLINLRTSNVVSDVKVGQQVGDDDPVFRISAVCLDEVVVTNSAGQVRRIPLLKLDVTDVARIMAIIRTSDERRRGSTNGVAPCADGQVGTSSHESPATNNTIRHNVILPPAPEEPHR